MSSFIENSKDRASIRSFVPNKPLSAKEKENLIGVVHSAPTSNNYFTSSCIFVTDKDLLHKLGELLNQKQVRDASAFLVFLADNNRVDYILDQIKEPLDNKTLNSLLVGVGDAFIQATMAQDAAVEMGLGTCFIGGVRSKIKEINKLLNVQGSAFPAIALAIGTPTESVKPKIKIPRVYENKYSYKAVINEIVDYSNKLAEHLKEKGIDGDYINASAKYLKREPDNHREVNIIRIWKLKAKKEDK